MLFQCNIILPKDTSDGMLYPHSEFWVLEISQKMGYGQFEQDFNLSYAKSLAKKLKKKSR